MVRRKPPDIIAIVVLLVILLVYLGLMSFVFNAIQRRFP
jgi:hypothetical protein